MIESMNSGRCRSAHGGTRYRKSTLYRLAEIYCTAYGKDHAVGVRALSVIHSFSDMKLSKYRL